MWSIGSSLIEWEETDAAMQSSKFQKLNAVVHLGIYVQVATCVFKVSNALLF